jgi:hypothetical protein
MMQAVIEECRKRRVSTVVLHASPQGRPLYERLGLVQTDEMLLTVSDERL